MTDCRGRTISYNMGGFLGLNFENACIYGGGSFLPGIYQCQEIFCLDDLSNSGIPSLADLSPPSFNIVKQAIAMSDDLMELINGNKVLLAALAVIFGCFLAAMVVSGPGAIAASFMALGSGQAATLASALGISIFAYFAVNSAKPTRSISG
ncbi:hypothetical protein [Haloferax mediterranei]|nr:hypothetical protein [Haloferax mediterranei]MDX5986913.1 hypothetical protein [Haloferax mediterranei ATCC 33500]